MTEHRSAAPQFGSNVTAWFDDHGRLILSLVLPGLLLLAVYSPTLLNVYDYHDAFYHYRPNSGCGTHPQWAYMLVVGRPVYNWIECALRQPLVRTVDDTYLVRLVGIALISGAAAFVCRMMMRAGVGLVFSALLGAALFALPGWNVFINMTSDVPNVFVAPISVVAFYFLTKARNKSAGAALIYLGATVICLSIASFIYQQLLPLFFVLIAIGAMTSRDLGETRWAIVTGTASFAAAGFCYLLVHAVLLLPHAEMLLGASAREVFPEDVADMAIKFEPIRALKGLYVNTPRIFSLWFMYLADHVVVAICRRFRLSMSSFCSTTERCSNCSPRRRGPRAGRMACVAVWARELADHIGRGSRRSATSFHSL